MRYRLAIPMVATGALLAAAITYDPRPAQAQEACDDRTDWPSSYTVGTASQGGTYFIYGSGWANLTAEALGLNAGGEVTGGPVQNLALVQTGDLEFGMTTMGPAGLALSGESPLAPGLAHDQVRAIFPMYETPFKIMTLASSGIDSIDSIPDGAVIGFGPAGGTSDTFFPSMLETLGVEFEKQNGGASDLAGQLQDGLIDVFAFAGGVPISAFSQLEAQVDVNIFGFTDEERATILGAFPVAPFAIPAEVYTSTDEDVPTVSMWNFAIASADLPECFVYHVVDAVMSNNDDMVQIHSAARATLPENHENNSLIPWHPGAVRWFEENGYDINDELEG
ncbi:MAG: TAXI family TRAP transporter solute-binding subunit [Pseudomonadota bacterium]